MERSKRKYTDIDTGFTVVSLAIEEGRNAPILTTFINGLSIRSHSLKLKRLIDIYVECVLVACDFPDTPEGDEASERVESEVRAFIATTYNPQD